MHLWGILPGVTIQLTHFSILNKEYVKWDEHAEVEDVNVVLHSHLQGSAGQRVEVDGREGGRKGRLVKRQHCTPTNH